MITLGIIILILAIILGILTANSMDDGGAGVAVWVVCSLFCIPFFVIGISKLECKSYAEITNLSFQYKYATGCLVKLDDKILTLDQYKDLQVPNTVYGNAEQNIKVKIEK